MTLHELMARARDAWDRAGRPGDYPQLRLEDEAAERDAELVARGAHAMYQRRPR